MIYIFPSTTTSLDSECTLLVEILPCALANNCVNVKNHTNKYFQFSYM